MSRYDDEPFLLWFTRPTATWLELSAEARGVAISVAMEIGHGKSGGITLRKGLQSLETTIRIPWAKLEPALAELIAAGKLTWDGARFVLFDPEFADRRRKTSADRMRDKRSRDLTPSKASPEASVCDASDVTSVTHVTESTCDAGDGTSNLISSDLSGSLGGAGGATPPAWFGEALETVEVQTGEKLRPPDSWLRYSGHRAGKGIAANQQDAVYWLATVMVPEARRERRAESDKRDRDAKFDAERAGRHSKFAPAETPPAPYHRPARVLREERSDPKHASAAMADMMAALNPKREAS